MRFLFVGDTHGTQHLDKVKKWLSVFDLRPLDVIVHAGDLGVAWGGEEDEALVWWRSVPCRVLVCLGNHENYGWIMQQPLVKRFRCQGYALGGGLFAPLAGQTAHIGGKTLWFYPGGHSVDFFFRRPGVSIYKEEMLPTKQAERILKNVLKRKHVDYIISHDGPRSFVAEHFGFPIAPPRSDYLKLMGEEPGGRAHPGFILDEIYRGKPAYGQWYFGHHHRDIAKGNVRCLWNQAVLQDTRTGSTDVIDDVIAIEG